MALPDPRVFEYSYYCDAQRGRTVRAEVRGYQRVSRAHLDVASQVARSAP